MPPLPLGFLIWPACLFPWDTALSPVVAVGVANGILLLWNTNGLVVSGSEVRSFHGPHSTGQQLNRMLLH